MSISYSVIMVGAVFCLAYLLVDTIVRFTEREMEGWEDA